MQNLHPKLYAEVDGLLPHSPNEVVHTICESLRLACGGHPHSLQKRLRRAKKVYFSLINGDVQRGKSSVEAFMCLIVQTINDSPRCADRCCSVLVTILKTWAQALDATVKAKTTVYRPREADSDDGERDDGAGNADGGGSGGEGTMQLAEENETLDLEAIEMLKRERLEGRGVKDRIKNVMRAGGVTVCFRTGAKYDCVADWIAEINDNLQPGERPTVPLLFLDEADQCIGKNTHAHFRSLRELLGLGNRSSYANRPAACVAVSATNVGTFYWLVTEAVRELRRAPQQPRLALLEILSFMPPRKGEYRGRESVSLLSDGEAMAKPVVGDDYVTDQVVKVYEEAGAVPGAVIMDATTGRVNFWVEHNMCAHIDEIEARLGAGAPEMAVIYLHGGHGAFTGMMGIEFINSPEEDDGLDRLRESIAEAAEDERYNGSEALADRLDELAEDLPLIENDYGTFVEAHALTPVAWYVADKSKRLGGAECKDALPAPLNATGHVDYENGRQVTVAKSLWSSAKLPLLMFIVHKFVSSEMTMPIMGQNMLKRSQPVVAVDYWRKPITEEEAGELLAAAAARIDEDEAAVAADDTLEPPPLSRADLPPVALLAGQPWALRVVTHLIDHRCENAPASAQRGARDSTTLLSLCLSRPEFWHCRKLLLEDAELALSGARSFNAAAPFQLPRAQRRAWAQELINRVLDDTQLASYANSLTEERSEWFAAIYGAVNAVNTHESELMLAVGVALAAMLPLPKELCQLLQRDRNPMFQGGVGSFERDTGNVHANLCCILEGHEPLPFRHALQRKQRAARQQGDSTVGKLVLEFLEAEGIRATNPDVAPACALEGKRIILSVADSRPDLVGTLKELTFVRADGKTHGNPGGYTLTQLYRKGKLDRVSRQNRVPHVNGTVPKSGSCFHYFLPAVGAPPVDPMVLQTTTRVFPSAVTLPVEYRPVPGAAPFKQFMPARDASGGSAGVPLPLPLTLVAAGAASAPPNHFSSAQIAAAIAASHQQEAARLQALYQSNHAANLLAYAASHAAQQAPGAAGSSSVHATAVGGAATRFERVVDI